MDVFSGSLVRPKTLEIPGQLPYPIIPTMTFVRGNDFTHDFSLADQSGEFPDMTGGLAWFSINAEEDGSTPILQKTLDDGLSLNEEEQVLTLDLSSADTNVLIPGFYVFDVQIMDHDGRIRTITKEVLSVTDRITPQLA